MNAHVLEVEAQCDGSSLYTIAWAWFCVRTVDLLSAREDFLNVARHDLMHLGELLGHSVQITLGLRVQVELLRLLDECVCTTTRHDTRHTTHDTRHAQRQYRSAISPLLRRVALLHTIVTCHEKAKRRGRCRTKLDEGVGSCGTAHLSPVLDVELLLDLVDESVCQLLGVRGVAQRQVAHVVLNLIPLGRQTIESQQFAASIKEGEAECTGSSICRLR